MGRTNYVLLGMGLAAILALSLLMNYVLGQVEGRSGSPINRELAANFSDRVGGQIACEIAPCRGGRRATVTVRPDPGVPHKRLARDIGQFVWRQCYRDGDLVYVHVVCMSEDGGRDRFDVPSPYALARDSGAAVTVRRLESSPPVTPPGDK